jgi:SET domain-containing protein
MKNLANSWLEVKTSLLPQAGQGLFAKRSFKKGQRITEYKGRLRKWKDVAHEDGINTYLMRVNRCWAIDAKPAVLTFGRYANDAAGTPGKSKKDNNAIYVTEGVRCFLEADRDIFSGDEILVDYGKEFWDLHLSGIQSAEPKQ